MNSRYLDNLDVSDIKMQVEFEDYDFDQRISQNYLIMQHALRDNEVETQTGRHGSDTANQLDRELLCFV